MQCTFCKKEITQPHTGRPKEHCNDACRKAAQRKRIKLGLPAKKSKRAMKLESRILEELKKVSNHNARAKNVRLFATLTLEQWLETLEHFNWKCAYCKTGKYELLEHFIPLNHGKGTTKDNCVPACSKCNSLKSAWNPLLDYGPDLSSIRDGLEDVHRYLKAISSTEA